MKFLLIVLFTTFAQFSYGASCETSLLEGQHIDLSESQAKTMAWEDVQNQCYPGKAKKESLQCFESIRLKGGKSIPEFRCLQQALCTLCGEALKRKQDTLD